MGDVNLKKLNANKRKTNIKYKSKPHNVIVQQKVEELKSTKRETSLPSNWSRYEAYEDDDVSVSEGANFETLLLEPISNDSYFKFKSEHNWDADINSQFQLSKYFNLDMKLLSEGIASVAFHKRHNYDESLFTHLELESIKRHSDNSREKYKKYVQQKFPQNNKIIIKKNVEVKTKTKKVAAEKFEEKSEIFNRTEKIAEKSEEIVEKPKEIIESIQIIERNEEINSNNDNCIDDLLNLKFSQQQISEEIEIKAEDPLLQPIEFKKTPVPQITMDLEQWLDDILDD